jgi:NAD(P)-dependent dehydrogenase (short-subunit alcohol dehydrogenase family)
MKVDLNGQVALVTGAARGIGQAIADLFVENGATVIYADVDHETAKASAARAGNKASAMALDVSNEAQVESCLTQILRDHRRLDILVNNAGINTAKHRVNIDQFPLDEWQRILNVDLTGLYLVSRAGSRAMVAQKSGRIINIASVLGVVPARLQCAFIAAKGGVIQLTRAMAIELAPSGILVNCVAPGSTLTEGTKALFYSQEAQMQERAQRMLSHVPLARPGTTAEIANSVLFFAAPESSYITGQILCVDGGWSAGGFLRDF